MTIYNSSILSDLESLSSRIKSLDANDKMLLISYFIHIGYLKPKGFSARFTSIVLSMLSKYHKVSNMTIWMHFLMNSDPGLTEQLTNSFTYWIVNGKDIIDDDSVGGYSQEEIHNISKFINILDKSTI